MELGGNIELIDFKDLDPAEMIVLKKIIGNYARKFSDHVDNYEKLTLHMKKAEGKHKYEVFGKLMHNQKTTNSEVTGTNIFITVSDALKKIENQLIK